MKSPDKLSVSVTDPDDEFTGFTYVTRSYESDDWEHVLKSLIVMVTSTEQPGSVVMVTRKCRHGNNFTAVCCSNRLVYGRRSDAPRVDDEMM